MYTVPFVVFSSTKNLIKTAWVLSELQHIQTNFLKVVSRAETGEFEHMLVRIKCTSTTIEEVFYNSLDHCTDLFIVIET